MEDLMKKLIFVFVLISCCTLFFQCGKKKDINVKRDFEYLYDVTETCVLTMVKAIQMKSGNKEKNVDKALDAIDAYITKEGPEFKAAGERLNSIILTEEESIHLIHFNEKYQTLTSKYIDYIQANITPAQKDRFVTLVVEGIFVKFIDELVTPKNTTDFFKKVIR